MTQDARLPQVLEEVAELIGQDGMWALVGAYGGRTIYVPAAIDETHKLAQLLGLEAATRLVLHFRDTTPELGHVGRKLLIPMASAAQKKAAWQQALDQSLTLPEIAAVMGVHERTALRHRSAARERDQPELF